MNGGLQSNTFFCKKFMLLLQNFPYAKQHQLAACLFHVAAIIGEQLKLLTESTFDIGYDPG